MEDEEARSYREPCSQCSEVNWGITDEGAFYCKSCHNVIERTKEIDDPSTVFTANSKSQSISRGLKNKKTADKGFEWYICEGFQYIILKQADALQDITNRPEFKDEIMCNFWRQYLQKSNQAYTNKRYHTGDRKATTDSSTSVSEWESELENLLHVGSSVSESDGVITSDSSLGNFSFASKASTSGSPKSNTSGSVDGGVYSNLKRKGTVLMSMPMTLSFCYMSLLWLRESITLSDLLRFVEEGHIPYMNCFQYFPEEMKLYGPDLKIFQVEVQYHNLCILSHDSFPSYRSIMKKTLQLAAFLDLPIFPPITESCFLHPNILCMKYLMEANLPDELHSWTCRVVEKTGIGEVDFLTFDPVAKSAHISYDVQAAAVIIVVLKLLFLLNDKCEWLLSDFVEERNTKNDEGIRWFDFRQWYKTMKVSVDEKEKKKEEDHLRFIWKSEKPLFATLKTKWHIYKKKQMAINLQRQFGRLAGTVQSAERKSPSSFQFIWDEENPHTTCFHGHSLEGIMEEKDSVVTTVNHKYWFSSLKLCQKSECRHWTVYEESQYPRSYQFLINLFCFLLNIEASLVHEEVSLFEKRLFKAKLQKKHIRRRRRWDKKRK